MKLDDLLKLFEKDAKVLDREISNIEDRMPGAEMDELAQPEIAFRKFPKVRRPKTIRGRGIISWEGIEGPLTPGSFPLPDTKQTSSFRDELKDIFAHATEQCPDIETMMSYVNHELDSVTADHVTAHILHCEDCAEEFMGLSNTSYRL
jgi:hypothetical protein